MKFIALILFSISIVTSQAQDSQAPGIPTIEYTSSIIDHSGIEHYIESHAIVVKKKPFVEGYRIQIFNGNNKEDAINAKADFYNKFPGMRCYTLYQQPYYKVRVGDFPNPESARGDLKKLAKFYPSSFLVPEMIRRVENTDDEDKK